MNSLDRVFNKILISLFALIVFSAIFIGDTTILLAESCCTIPSHHGKWNAARPDGHAPIGVMGDHSHGAGEFMFTYRYKFMDMNGNRIGTNKVSNQKVLEDFMVTPTDMTMQMHMFSLMYAPTDYITVMGMIPYVKKSMNHLTRMGNRFRTETDGIGDTKLSALIKVFDNYNLTSLYGLNNITSVNWLYISNNPVLASLDGLNNLEEVELHR